MSSKQRGYIVTFEPGTDRARIALDLGTPPAHRGKYATSHSSTTGDHCVIRSRTNLHLPEYHVRAPSATRAEQIARAMRKK